jgi:hypothetical protein
MGRITLDMKWKNVPNHQPVVDYHLFGGIQVLFDYPKIIWDLTSLQKIIRNIILNHSPVGCHFDHFSMLHREASQWMCIPGAEDPSWKEGSIFSTCNWDIPMVMTCLYTPSRGL